LIRPVGEVKGLATKSVLAEAISALGGARPDFIRSACRDFHRHLLLVRLLSQPT
jgi:hypothetical protein